MSSINKGFNLRVADFEESLVKGINSSELPLITIKTVLEGLLNQCITKLQIEIANEKKEFEEAIKKEQEEAIEVEVIPLHVDENGEVHPLKVVKVGEE